MLTKDDLKNGFMAEKGIKRMMVTRPERAMQLLLEGWKVYYNNHCLTSEELATGTYAKYKEF